MTLSAVAAEPGDEATRELRVLHAVHERVPDTGDFDRQMIAARRLVVRLHVRHAYGIALDKPPGT